MATSGFSVEQDSAVQAYKQIRRQYLAAEEKRKEETKQRQRTEKLMAPGNGEKPASERRLSIARMLKRVVRADVQRLSSQSTETHGPAKLLDTDSVGSDVSSGGVNVTLDLKEACAMEVPGSS